MIRYRLTIEEQLQGGLSFESQGDLQGELKVLSEMAQGEQGDLSHQLSYLQNQVGENPLELIQSPLEKKLEIIQEIEEVDVSKVSLNQTEQEVQLSLDQQNNNTLLASLDYSDNSHRTSDVEGSESSESSEVTTDQDSESAHNLLRGDKLPTVAMAKNETVKIGDKILDVMIGVMGVVEGLTQDKVIYRCREWGVVSRHGDLVTVLG